MASNTQFNTGGYEYQFVEDPSNDLKCSICLCVARDPLQHGEGGCGKIFCRECITTHRRKSSQCPNCRRRIITFKDERSERDIQSLKVKCDKEKKGCEWTGELRSLRDHTQTCGYVLVPCTNECKVYSRKRLFSEWPQGKVVTVYRKDLQKHLEECPRRQYTCPHCKKTDEYEHITGFHARIDCPKIRIKCPNAPQCEKTFLREDKETHLSVCLYQKLPCKYKEVGCATEPYRKDLQGHESDDKAHLRITMDTLLKTTAQCASLTKECTKLREQVAGLHATVLHFHGTLKTCELPVSPFTFKIENFCDKQNKSDLYSPPFLSHLNGYKMEMNISFEEAYVLVQCHLMRGEYDDQLIFPFKGSFVIELLNQLEDNNHFQTCVKEHDTLDTNRKTIDYRYNFLPLFMVSKFIHHKNLTLNAAKNCQYLKDDCLVFRVHVEVPSYKPWLQCTGASAPYTD